MRKAVSYTAALLCASIAVALAATDKEQVISREKAAWQAFKDKKSDDFRKIFSDNYRGIYADNIGNREAEMQSMREMELKSFSLSDFDVISTDDDTVVVTYKVNMQFTEGGKESSGTYHSASVWQKEGNDWHAILHTNVKAEKSEAGKTGDS